MVSNWPGEIMVWKCLVILWVQKSTQESFRRLISLMTLLKARKCWHHWDYILQAVCFTVRKTVASVCFDPASGKDIKWLDGEGRQSCSCWSRILVRVHCDFPMPFLSQLFSYSFEYVVAPLAQLFFRAEGKVYSICLFNFRHFKK